MAAILQKLLRKPPPTRTITSLTHQSQSLDLRLPLSFHETHFHETNLQHFLNSSSETEKSNPSHSSQIYPTFSFGFFLNPISSSGFVQSESKTEELNILKSSQIYRTFPFGYVLNPISSTGLAQSEQDEAVSDDSGMIWADSVKKKRKKKMNKHKLKKLRKSLRRKA